MRYSRLLPVLFLAWAVCAPSQTPQPPKRKKLLFIGASKGFQHDSISHAAGTIWKLGQETKLWDTWIRTDTQLITKKKLTGNAKNLDYFDAIMFYTTGELDLDEEQKASFLAFIKEDGKGFIGTHSATDTFYKWPEYNQLIGAWFDGHPWHQEVDVEVKDRTFIATEHFPPNFKITDEIYQFKDWSADRTHELMRLTPDKVDFTKKNIKRTDKDFGVTWQHNYGKGRVFYSSLGHREEVWDRADIQKMWVQAIKWAMGMAPSTSK